MDARQHPEFHTEEIELGSTTVVRLNGELDVVYQPQVTAAFDSALSRKPTVLVADLRGLGFMDSTGIHALIEAEQRCRQEGVRFLLIRGSAAIDRLLALLGLDRLFEIVSGSETLPGAPAPLTAAAADAV